MVATSNAADEETPLPSGTPEETWKSTEMINNNEETIKQEAHIMDNISVDRSE
jgi:hypothetical protein